MLGLEFYARHHDPKSSDYIPQHSGFQGVERLVPGDFFLLEDLRLRFCAIVIDSADPGITNFSLRRSVVTDSFGDTSAHSQGAFLEGLNGNALIEGNVFDANGWYEPDGEGGIGKTTWFNHNLYIKEANDGGGKYPIGLMFRNNIIARPSGDGLKASSDHYHAFNNLSIENNLMIRGDDAIGFNHSSGVQDMGPTHYNFEIKNNVITEPGRHYVAQNTDRAGGIVILTAEKGVIANNFFLHKNYNNANNGVIAIGQTNQPNRDMDINGNTVFDWLDPRLIRLPDNGENITEENNLLNPDASTFVDPSRSVESYNASVGGKTTLDDFLNEARKQSRLNWSSNYWAPTVNDYLRAGFALSQ